jgi:hypothetical protein
MSDSITRTPSPHLEYENESVPIEVDDADVIVVEDEEEDGAKAGSKRKLTSTVWKEFKRVKINGSV